MAIGLVLGAGVVGMRALLSSSSGDRSASPAEDEQRQVAGDLGDQDGAPSGAGTPSGQPVLVGADASGDLLADVKKVFEKAERAPLVAPIDDVGEPDPVSGGDQPVPSGQDESRQGENEQAGYEQDDGSSPKTTADSEPAAGSEPAAVAEAPVAGDVVIFNRCPGGCADPSLRSSLVFHDPDRTITGSTITYSGNATLVVGADPVAGRAASTIGVSGTVVINGNQAVLDLNGGGGLAPRASSGWTRRRCE